jgi:hypothetical protein
VAVVRLSVLGKIEGVLMKKIETIIPSLALTATIGFAESALQRYRMLALNRRKEENMNKHHRRYLVIMAFLICISFLLPGKGEAQESPLFSKEELHQMLAPIALYPDPLITQIMMASTYPLEIVQAAQWQKSNEGLSGDALESALQGKNWDPSVKALTQFPTVLAKMGENVEWTSKLGDAFLAQQKDVTDAMQELRAKAHAEGNLKTTEQQTVIVEKETIVIQPAQPEVVYVPSYSPTVVYGSWYYPAYPPVVVGPPPGTGIVAFGLGVAVGAALDDDWGWHDHHWDWHGGDIDIDVDRNVNRDTDRSRDRDSTRTHESGSRRETGSQGKWEHNPEHRKGAAYRDQSTSQRFGQDRSQTRRSSSDYRGYSSQDRGSTRQTSSRTPERAGTQSGRTGTQQRDTSTGQRSSRSSGRSASGRSQYGSGSAFSGVGSGNSARSASQRGQYSRSGGSSSGSRSRSSGGSRGGGRGR